VQKGNIIGTQFHPEKSGKAGIKMLENFICQKSLRSEGTIDIKGRGLSKRIIACLDVRSNDHGDLVVTKGDQYDVRQEGEVRNLGKPVELAKRYYEEGADEITFLNITGFRDFPLKDMPMIKVLEETSKNVFVPLTIGGGIRDYTDLNGKTYTSLDVASKYFRSGADKISIGSDAVYIAEQYLKTGQKTGKSSIEQIARVYGNQAVVISVDPRRVYVSSPDDAKKHHVIKTKVPGPDNEKYCWYQCTVQGGRSARDLDAVALAKACEKLGAGEILLNCIDKDGSNSGFDLELINAVKDAVTIPVIASSGAGCEEHFAEVFNQTNAEAALAAGIFHRKEVLIQDIKIYLADNNLEIRNA
jgi:glutamine amidotransferase/cyclase